MFVFLCQSYLQFHKALKVQGHDRNELAYKAPFQPYLTYYGFVMLTLIIITNGFQLFIPGNWSVFLSITSSFFFFLVSIDL